MQYLDSSARSSTVCFLGGCPWLRLVLAIHLHLPNLFLVPHLTTFSEPELEVLDSDVVEISMTVLGVTGTACGHSVSSFTGCS